MSHLAVWLRVPGENRAIGLVSNRLLKAAWKALCGASGKKLLLVWLCDHAHEDGLSWPSIKTLCYECDMSERTVQGHLSDLEKDGLIRVERRGGRHLVSRYFVLLNPAIIAPLPEKPRRICAKPRKFRTPILKNPKENPKGIGTGTPVLLTKS